LGCGTVFFGGDKLVTDVLELFVFLLEFLDLLLVFLFDFLGLAKEVLSIFV
jgi:hypothetical protein